VETGVAELLAWIFHSPRRLLAVLIGFLAVVVGVGLLVQAAMPGQSPPGTTPTGVTAAGPDAEQATQAALAFTRAWASKPEGQTAEQWRQSLVPLTTPDLQRGLSLTDPATLPGGRPQGTPTVRFIAVASSLVEVPLSTGSRVLVTVVRVNAHWIASDVQPVSGNAGDVPAAPAGSSSGDTGTSASASSSGSG
jgi:hypothetical protein